MCEIIIVKNPSEANAITHNGRFHGDDIMSTVILMKYFGSLKVYRTDEVPKWIDTSKVIVYDIGHGRFDHHQKDGNGVRFNGVPYASAGLIWGYFGRKWIEETGRPFFIWKSIDRSIIQGIDAVDCGKMPYTNYPAQVMDMSKMISSFNPTWKNDNATSYDEAFLKAVRFAETIFDNLIAIAEAKADITDFVEEAIEAVDEHVMVLEHYVPWQGRLYASENPNATEVQFVVFPSNRGIGYNWQCVPIESGSYELRKNAPLEWHGLVKDELRRVCGVKTANFCHPAGFIGGAETLEDTIKMAKIASCM